MSSKRGIRYGSESQVQDGTLKVEAPFRTDLDTLKGIEEIADHEDRSRSYIISIALEKVIEKFTQDHTLYKPEDFGKVKPKLTFGPKKNLNVRLNPAIVKQVEIIAQHENRSRANVMHIALQKLVELYRRTGSLSGPLR